MHSATSQDQNLLVPAIVKNRIIKIDFFSPLTGNTTLGYEQVFANSITLTGDIGIIGASLAPISSQAKGVFVKAGTKFYFSPDYLIDGMKRFNDFQGTYFSPQIIYSGFGFDYNMVSYRTDRGVNNSFALMLEFGKQ
jgi:hypothetical protein